MTVNYTQALRGQFFDITQTGTNPEELLANARHHEDAVLFLNEGTVVALLPWEEGRSHLLAENDYIDYRGKLIIPGLASYLR